MRTRTETIRLGEHEWAVRPLTLRQVQEIEPILLAGAPEATGNVSAAMAIVAIALRRDHARGRGRRSAMSKRRRRRSAPPWRRSSVLADFFRLV